MRSINWLFMIVFDLKPEENTKFAMRMLSEDIPVSEMKKWMMSDGA